MLSRAKKFCLTALLSAMAISAQEASAQTIKADVFLYSYNDPFIKELSSYYKDPSIVADFKIGIYNSSQDMLAEQSLISRALTKKTQGIIVNPVDANNVKSLIEIAKKADCPIVFINRKPSDEDLLSYDKAFFVGSNSKLAGNLQADIMDCYFKEHTDADKNGDGVIHYALIEGEVNHQDTIQRNLGLNDALEVKAYKYEKDVSIVANWDYNQAYKQFSNYIANPAHLASLECIFSNNDAMAGGVIHALQEKGYNLGQNNEKYIPIIGVDATSNGKTLVDKGYMIASLKNDARAQVMLSLKIISLLNEGKSVDSESLGLNVSSQSLYVPYSVIE